MMYSIIMIIGDQKMTKSRYDYYLSKNQSTQSANQASYSQYAHSESIKISPPAKILPNLTTKKCIKKNCYSYYYSVLSTTNKRKNGWYQN